MAFAITNGYSPLRGQSQNALTAQSSSAQASKTERLENDLSQTSSMTLPTFIVKTPATTISAISVTRVSNGALRCLDTFSSMVATLVVRGLTFVSLRLSVRCCVCS